MSVYVCVCVCVSVCVCVYVCVCMCSGSMYGAFLKDVPRMMVASIPYRYDQSTESDSSIIVRCVYLCQCVILFVCTSAHIYHSQCQ